MSNKEMKEKMKRRYGDEVKHKHNKDHLEYRQHEKTHPAQKDIENVIENAEADINKSKEAGKHHLKHHQSRRRDIEEEIIRRILKNNKL